MEKEIKKTVQSPIQDDLHKKYSGFTFVLGDKARNAAPKLIIDHQQSVPMSSFTIFIKKYLRSKIGMVGLIILVFVVLLAVIGPLI